MFTPTTLLNFLIMNDQIMNGSGQGLRRFKIENGQRIWLDKPLNDEWKIPKKEDLNAPIKKILNLSGQLQPLDQLYTIKECLKALLDKEEEAHIMDESFSTGQVDDLNEAYDLMTAIYDYDPTPQHLYDDSGGEPPITMNEMVNQAYKEKYGK